MAGASGKGATETDTFVGTQPKVASSKWKSFLTFLYEKDTGKVLGRTGKSWLQITVFYLIFYGVLAAFFAVLLVLFLQTLDPNEPKWKGTNGIIGDNPGMGFRPTPPDSGSTLIWVRKNNNTNAYIDNLQQFVDSYNPGQHDKEQVISCTPTNKPTQENKKFCAFNVADFGPCHAGNQHFGYDSGQPCVLIKLNKIFGWVPDLPVVDKPEPNMDKLAQLRHAYSQMNNGAPLPDTTNKIFITCGGQDAVDKEHIGPIKVYPDGLNAAFFPYTGAPGYQAPAVMIQFQNPDPGVLINVECKAWANNIHHSRTDRLGSVYFELLVDR